jgi:hypothetical protein
MPAFAHIAAPGHVMSGASASERTWHTPLQTTLDNNYLTKAGPVAVL